MTYKDQYSRWMQAGLTGEPLAELNAIAGDEAEIESRFAGFLAFGTAGLRGLVGMGTDRMNLYTVRAAAHGFALALKQAFPSPRAAVCFDARAASRPFAEQCALVLAGQGIEVHMFSNPRPTPQLSFAIRRFGLDGGINITASHNPKGYSGLKAYWRGGAQITGETAALVAGHMLQTDPFAICPPERADINYYGSELDELFIEACASRAINRGAIAGAGGLKIVYTAFHGVGGAVFPQVLRRAGFTNVECLPSQIEPDGEFPTIADPNPENPEGFALAIEHARRVGAGLVIGTDPDADRVAAVVVGQSGRNHAITGSQMGALLTDYILSAREEAGTLPEKCALVQTIVTGPLSLEIARAHGAVCAQTFTGFRFMAEEVERLKARGIEYMLAYEEAIGYMEGGHVRDKDGITAGLLIAEMAAHHHARGRTLTQALRGLWQKYGAHAERAFSLPFAGPGGGQRMSALMNALRGNPARELCGMEIVQLEDYLTGTRTTPSGTYPLDKSGMDVLIFRMNDCSLILRPSGTEPKVKAYIRTKAQTIEQAELAAQQLEGAARAMLNA